jgi:hypothetical protein
MSLPLWRELGLDSGLSVKRHWPAASIVERLGEHLFVVYGVTPHSRSARVADAVVESAVRTAPNADLVLPPRAAAWFPPKFKRHTEPFECFIPDFRFIVEVTETEIISRSPEGKIERVAFADLRAVIIETNDSGPFATDLIWILIGTGSGSGCVYPENAIGAEDALRAFQKLPGFDNEQLIQAMVSTHNASFLCWQAAPNPAFNADPSASDSAG